MAPRAVSGKNALTEKPVGRAEPPNGAPTRGVLRRTERKTKETQKQQRSKLKGWLETKADWEKFDAWAKINAQPRKIPEPTRAVRRSKPLAQMRKRIELLARPHNRPETVCQTDLGVSKKALTAKPSKRILKLAMFVAKNTASCREFPITITRAALRYKISQRINEISRPRNLYLSEHCSTLMSQVGISSGMTARRQRLALVKKAIECPDLLTDEEIDVLMTPTGIYRSALTYKFTPWMIYLSLPSYRFLKDRTDGDANEWKKFILEENDSRGKRALEEKTKRKKRQERAVKIKELDARQGKNEDEKADAEDSGDTALEEKSEENAADTSNMLGSRTNDSEQNLGATESEKTMKNEERSNARQRGKAGDPNEYEKDTEEKEVTNEQKATRNAWRFEPPPCIDNPFAIKRSALKGKVSPRMAELAMPHSRKDRSRRRDPFVVRKSALKGPVPERITELAKPSHPLDPVERPPPREKDSLGRPIYPMPLYGKKMPRIKPYQPAECPEENVNDDDVDDVKSKRKKHRSIDPIVYEATIDPCIDPQRAKRQLNARKFAKEEIKRRKQPDSEAEKDTQPSKT